MEQKTHSSKHDGTLCPGKVVHGDWLIEKEIGSGGFGTVYKATGAQGGLRPVAIKMTKNASTAVFSEILWELSVYKNYQYSRHCAKLIGYNVEEQPHFLVMELLGPSLSTLRKRMENRLLPQGSVAAIIRQCLEALKDLHDAYFIHRDVKPANFVIGNGHNARTIYLIDFGMCRRYCKNDGHLLEERPSVGFRGTLRYASCRAHMQKDLSRADDLVSLFYMTYEMLNGELPWKWETDSTRVENYKSNFSPTHMAADQHNSVKVFSMHVQSLHYDSEPNYGALNKALEQMMNEKGFTETSLYGWEHVIQDDEKEKYSPDDSVKEGENE